MNADNQDDFKPEQLTDVSQIKPLTDDQRYSTWQVDYQGAPAFLKHAKNEKTRGRMDSEVWGLLTMARLAKLDLAPFRVPKLLSYDIRASWVLTQWVAGQELSKADYPKANVVAAMDTMLGIYIFMDGALKAGASAPVELTHSNSGQAVVKKIADKLADIPNTTKPLEPRLLKETLNFIERHYDQLEPRFAHGDLTPKHVMAADDGGLPFVIDFESCSLHWPRFYELINYTTKLSVVHDQAVVADKMIDRFFDGLGEPVTEHIQALKVITAVRTLLIVHELGWHDVSQRIYGTQLNPKHIEAVGRNLRQILA